MAFAKPTETDTPDFRVGHPDKHRREDEVQAAFLKLQQQMEERKRAQAATEAEAGKPSPTSG